MMVYMKVVGACLFVLGHLVGESFSRPEKEDINVRCEANLRLLVARTYGTNSPSFLPTISSVM
jgi:hypothetical protein